LEKICEIFVQFSMDLRLSIVVALLRTNIDDMHRMY